MIDCQTTVQVGGMLLLVNVQGFQYSSLPVVPFYFSCVGSLKVHLVLVSPSMGCNSIVGSHVSSPLSGAHLGASQGPTGFPNVHTLTVLAWNFVDNTFLLPVFRGLFHLH